MWGITESADFTADTWTFKMNTDDWQVSKGAYAIVYNDDWQVIQDRLDKLDRACDLLHALSAEGMNLPEKLRDRITDFFLPSF